MYGWSTYDDIVVGTKLNIITSQNDLNSSGAFHPILSQVLTLIDNFIPFHCQYM